MKLTRNQLRRLILEEVRLLNEGYRMSPNISNVAHESSGLDQFVSNEYDKRNTSLAYLRIANAIKELDERLQKIERPPGTPTEPNAAGYDPDDPGI